MESAMNVFVLFALFGAWIMAAMGSADDVICRWNWNTHVCVLADEASLVTALKRPDVSTLVCASCFNDTSIQGVADDLGSTVDIFATRTVWNYRSESQTLSEILGQMSRHHDDWYGKEPRLGVWRNGTLQLAIQSPFAGNRACAARWINKARGLSAHDTMLGCVPRKMKDGHVYQAQEDDEPLEIFNNGDFTLIPTSDKDEVAQRLFSSRYAILYLDSSWSFCGRKDPSRAAMKQLGQFLHATLGTDAMVASLTVPGWEPYTIEIPAFNFGKFRSIMLLVVDGAPIHYLFQTWPCQNSRDAQYDDAVIDCVKRWTANTLLKTSKFKLEDCHVDGWRENNTHSMNSTHSVRPRPSKEEL